MAKIHTNTGMLVIITTEGIVALFDSFSVTLDREVIS